jgi:Tol biopolymer transport system component/DNA-binding winged helix-turn-helix (wHTH) protein
LQHTFRIGGAYHVEPSLNRVTGPGGSSRLEPKVMLVLVCLAEHARQVVPKDRLFHAAWPDTAVSDDVLTRAISELRRLFEDDPKQPRVIETIPKSGYRLIAPVERESVGPPSLATTLSFVLPDGADPQLATREPAPTPRRWRGRLIRVGAAGLAVAVLAGAWRFTAFRPNAPPAMRVVPLTAMSGSEYGGAFSPDGRQVAFCWNGEMSDGGTRQWWQGNWDIYIKAVGSSQLRRLTTDPGTDLAPEWSPDGLQIAYVRMDGPNGSPRIRVVSALGGSDRQVSDFPVFLPAMWTPDSRYLVAARAGAPEPEGPSHGVYLIPVGGGEPRAITRARPSGQDLSAVFSADGHRLAYVGCPGPGPDSDCHVQVVNVDARFAAIGSPRRLTGPPFPGGDSSLAWTPDGRFLIFNARDMQLSYLWRVDVDGGAAPERIEQAGLDAFWPYTAPTGERLAFTRKSHDEDIYRFEPGRPAQPIAPSSLFDGMPQFSPDGRRIAFCSLRSGDAMEVWVANADGSSAEQVTHGPGRFQCGPSWSPDGHRIAFHSAGDHVHVWTVDSEGGTPRQISNDAGDQLDPTWSHDGEWIYFSWSQTTGRDIWRVRVSNGSKERVTNGGGFIASESVDGSTLLYISKSVDSPLMAQPLAGGAPRQVIDCVAGTAFAVQPAGIFYLPCSGTSTADADPTVLVRNPATGEDRTIGTLEKFERDSLPSGFAVSPDGRSILYGRLVKDESDLMLIENFK